MCLPLRGRLLPENWPVSAISLFMFSGGQARLLASTLMTDDTRVVLSTAGGTREGGLTQGGGGGDGGGGGGAGGLGREGCGGGTMASPTDTPLVGRTIAHHGAVSRDDGGVVGGGGEEVVHDCVMRVIGFTLLHRDLRSTVPTKGGGEKCEWDTKGFVRALQDVLIREGRVFETATGRPLVRAHFVRMESATSKTVAEVIVDGNALLRLNEDRRTDVGGRTKKET